MTRSSACTISSIEGNRPADQSSRGASLGSPVFHLAWLRPALFASVLYADEKRRYNNAGAQIDLRFSVLHWYEMTLSAGYATGFRGGNRAGEEWMISLKIM